MLCLYDSRYLGDGAQIGVKFYGAYRSRTCLIGGAPKESVKSKMLAV